jgi:hypothetical protein
MVGSRTVVVATLTAALAGSVFVTAQDLHPSRRPSPMGMARITLGDAYVRVVYGRPTSVAATTSSARRRAARSCRSASAGARARTRPPRSP